ncbi:GNAT family N-acetyltransferase [Shewanella sp. UCD-KL12]|uniref:GNAT family N-acetyltransferase n=1 Tax=Shewanella sp. UCD-KL12 TaxID=1917163 RepID=UPI0009707AFB|nr:GNAT family N-acetyltransferase [Shewanella sp. UCD-KL12]
MENTQNRLAHCQFSSSRLDVSACPNLVQYDAFDELARSVIEILTPNVTTSLPPGWDNIHSLEQAKSWLKDRVEECTCLLVRKRESGQVIGFIFLYSEHNGAEPLTLHLGYLIAETEWGQGFASEIIQALVQWLKSLAKESQTKQDLPSIRGIIGGVESSNLASIAVLVKNGFSLCEQASTSIDEEEDLVHAADGASTQAFYQIIF